MKTFALVGKSGTGKSFRALDVAHKNNIEAVIDDGLLISDRRVLAGKSAKHEASRMASVKRAIFAEDSHAESVKSALKQNTVDAVLILGTSDKMVEQIAKRLDLCPIEHTIYIEDISTPEELALAKASRNIQGKHIIPVPVFEVKKHFSGYFLRSFFSQGRRDDERTIIRPTYSYLGKFRISPKVISDICHFEISKLDGVCDITKLKSVSDAEGCIDIFIDITLSYPCDIPKITADIQDIAAKAIEDYTSIIVKTINIFVKSLNLRGNEND